MLDAVDAPQVLEFKQADGGGDDDGGQRAAGQVAQQVGRQQQQDGHGNRPDDAGKLRARAGRLGHGRARCAAADGKPLEESRRQVGHAQPHHFLVRIHARVRARGVGARQHAGIRKRDQRHGAAAQHDRGPVRIAQPRQGERRQPLRDFAQHVDAMGVQPKEADGQGRQNHGNQNAGYTVKAL
ncbi:hypothetical protein D3C85_414600 [compost metagenome]